MFGNRVLLFIGGANFQQAVKDSSVKKRLYIVNICGERERSVDCDKFSMSREIPRYHLVFVRPLAVANYAMKLFLDF